MAKKEKRKKKIDRIKIKLPNTKYQPTMEEMREEIHIPLTPNQLAYLVVKDYDIEYEK